MINMLWPILMVVGCNIVYHLVSKNVPSEANALAALTVAYVVAAIASGVLFLVTSHGKSIIGEVSRLNWTSLVLGLAIVGLEFGYIFVYRNGWKISVGSLVANISLACILLIIGIIFYEDAISVKQMIGVVSCVVGLILINI